MNKLIKEKKVSIITACFNNKDTIIDTFKSILNQTYNCIEYIVIDGGSTDGTLDIIKRYESEFIESFSSFVFLSEKDEGIADAWNKGLNLSTGDIIFFLNSDDWIDKETVTIAVESIGLNELAISYGLCNRINEQGEEIGSFQKTFNKYRVIWNFGFSFTTCFCTKNIYNKIGGFNTEYKIAIDSDFLLRAVKNKVKFIKGNQTINMRIGGVSTKFRKRAHEEYRKSLIANNYPKFLVNISHFFFRNT